jgi:hypothetical protein
MHLTELVVASHRILDEAGIRHAIGGAVAMAYHGRPRATMDVDINVFATADAAPLVLDLFVGIGFRPDGPLDGRLPVAGIPLRQDGGGATADLFFAIDASYVGFVDRSELVPFGPEQIQIPILCADDLVVFKLSFGRPRDWVDLEDLLATETPLDLDAIEDRLIGLRGPTLYPRVARLRSMSSDAGR